MRLRSAFRLAESGIRAVLTDIEGTTTPIAFVHEALFPFARANLAGFLRDRASDPAVAAELDAVRRAAPGRAPLDVLLDWMDRDAKETPLKALQGMIWRQGYEAGQILGVLYPDVPGCLRAWHAAGVGLFVYSSGSVPAQKLLFGHSDAGDLAGLFSGFFDTRVGPKREAASYRAIAAQIDVAPGAILFLSDVEAELDAAAAAGLSTCQLVRVADKTIASARHRVAAGFDAISF
jgi:enolase-phosphatase E1